MEPEERDDLHTLRVLVTIAVPLLALFALVCFFGYGGDGRDVIINSCMADESKIETVENKNVVGTFADFGVPTYEPAKSVQFFNKTSTEVGAIKWDDTDGDGKPNFRWEGSDIEESARLFIRYLTNITNECECPKEPKP